MNPSVTPSDSADRSEDGVVDVGGLRVFVSRRGAGPALLMLHGLFVDHRVWGRVLPLLAEHFHCVCIDLPGFGASDKPDPQGFSYSPENQARVVVGVLDALGLSAVHLCGHSMGAGVALRVAAEHPSRVVSLSLVDALGFPFAMPFEARLPMLPIVGSAIFRSAYRFWMFRRYFRTRVFQDATAMDETLVQAFYEAFNTPEGRSAAHASMRELFRPQPARRLASKVLAPTLVLWGEADQIFPVGLAHELHAALGDSRLEVLTGCGHSPIEEQPRAAAALLIEHHCANLG